MPERISSSSVLRLAIRSRTFFRFRSAGLFLVIATMVCRIFTGIARCTGGRPARTKEVSMPITSPSMFSTGPPFMPGLKSLEICISSSLPRCLNRETIFPCDKVTLTPSGLPIAMISSPMLIDRATPGCSGGGTLAALRSRATPQFESVSATNSRSSIRSSASSISIRTAPSRIFRLVAIRPSSEMTNPLPLVRSPSLAP